MAISIKSPVIINGSLRDAPASKLPITVAGETVLWDNKFTQSKT